MCREVTKTLKIKDVCVSTEVWPIINKIPKQISLKALEDVGGSDPAQSFKHH